MMRGRMNDSLDLFQQDERTWNSNASIHKCCPIMPHQFRRIEGVGRMVCLDSYVMSSTALASG